MSKFKSDKVMPRYFAIAVVLTLIGFAIVGKALYIMTAKKTYWTQVASRLKRDSVSVKPSRGNILSCDGQLMATSIPEYRVYIDFQAGTLKIKQQLQRQGETDELVPLKNSKPRYLTAPAFVMQLLKEERVHQMEQRFAAGELWQGWQSAEEMKTALVFLRDDGSNITAAALYQADGYYSKLLK